MIITHLTSQPELWNEMVSPPILVSKGNVMIGYNPIYEYAALPDVKRIVAALRRAMALETARPRAVVTAPRPEVRSAPEPASAKKAAGIGDPGYKKTMGTQKIVVPIMGEGICNAKVVTVVK